MAVWVASVARMFEVVERTAIDQDVWNAAVERSPQAWLWHLHDLPGALATWETRRDLSFALFDKGIIVALVPLQAIILKKVGPFVIRRLESFGGIAGPEDSVSEGTRTRAVEEIRKIALEEKAVYVDFVLSPLAPSYRGPGGPRVNPLLEIGCENTLSQTWLVDLSEDEDIIWKGISKRTREYIRRAEATGVVVELGGDERSLDSYYELHLQTYRRTGVVPHPIEYFKTIWERFVPEGHSRILLAVIDGKVEAGLNVAVYKGAGCYWTGASSPAGQTFRANHFLQWQAMRWLKSSGARWYETGEAHFGTAANKYRGISNFKQKFGGMLVPFYKGRLPLDSSARSRLLDTYFALKGR